MNLMTLADRIGHRAAEQAAGVPASCSVCGVGGGGAQESREVSVVAVYDEGWSLRGLAFFVGLGVGARRVTQSQSGFMWVCKPDNLCV